MSVHYEPDRRRYVVRWREDGRQRARRFATEGEAESFDAEVNPHGRAARQAARPSRTSVEARVARVQAERSSQQTQDGLYAYAARHGVRWRFVYRQSDGSLSSRRGFTSRTGYGGVSFTVWPVMLP
jgi:hypothetical protein